MSSMGKDIDDAVPGESFMQRFSRRKVEAREQQRTAVETALPNETDDELVPVPPALTDADMPPIESLDESSDYSGFLSEKVSEGLRRAALRKLFHGSAFNVIDELDDYAEDFTTFAPLGDLVTADMRHRIEAEARKQAERIADAFSSENTQPDTPDAEPSTLAAREHDSTAPQPTREAIQMAEQSTNPKPAPNDDDDLPTHA
ncbi:MAG: DUF3306 domain-containing protein [Gammaproteobacteria bacterium]|nr:DUF3306 domain-containing protein [Gammaproteobacteria bacterium]